MREYYECFLIFAGFAVSYAAIIHPDFIFPDAVMTPADGGGWLYEYQGLIAGILAIFAAFIGGSFVLRAAKYTPNLEAVSEARSYMLDIMSIGMHLQTDTYDIKQERLEQGIFLRNWKSMLTNMPKLKPATKHLLNLTGPHIVFEFHLKTASDTLLKLQNGSLNISSDKDAIVQDLETLREEVFIYVEKISTQCKKFEQSNLC